MFGWSVGWWTAVVNNVEDVDDDDVLVRRDFGVESIYGLQSLIGLTLHPTRIATPR